VSFSRLRHGITDFKPCYNTTVEGATLERVTIQSICLPFFRLPLPYGLATPYVLRTGAKNPAGLYPDGSPEGS
jgi:hypothetical protein